MPTVGEILSTERRRQGKQITDVVEGTKIRSRLLDALEQGRYDDLPSPAYVKGYIQSYARYLEIPAEPLLEQFRTEASATVRRSTPIDQYLAAIPAETVVPRRGTAHEIPRNVWIIVAAVIVFFFLILCVITQCTNRTPDANTNPAVVPAGSTTGTQSVGATNTSTVTTGTAQGAAFTLRVSVRAGMASTVKITVDGLSGFDGTMQGGESREFRVNDTVTMTIGKPDAVVITRDGKAVTIPATANAEVTLSTTD
jgi:cytoskeletal protein RodZ